MKTLPFIIGILISLQSSSFAILLSIPDVPVPKTTAVEAIEIAQKQIKNDPKLVLVGIDWCQASSFQPRISDGTQYHSMDDDPNGYSWFITYIYNKDDGSIGRLIGTRT